MHKGWQYIALILLFCLPVIAAVVASDYSMLCSLVQRDGDPALAEMAVQEAGQFERILGPYSRFGWNHPGPLVYYLLWPFYALVQCSIGLQISAFVVKILILTISGALLIRLPRTSAFLLLFCLQLLLLLDPVMFRSYSTGPYMFSNLFNTWNPVLSWFCYLGLISFSLSYLFRNRERNIIAATIFASLCIQTNMGLSAQAALTILSAYIIRNRNTKYFGATSPWTWMAVLLALLSMIPIFAEMLLTNANNLELIVKHIRSPYPSAGLMEALHILLIKIYMIPVGLLELGTPITVSAENQSILLLPIFCAEIGLSIYMLLGRFSEPPVFKEALTLILVLLASGLFLIARFPTPVFDYSIEWISVLGIFWHALLGQMALRRMIHWKNHGLLDGFLNAALCVLLLIVVVKSGARFGNDLREMVNRMQVQSTSHFHFQKIRSALGAEDKSIHFLVPYPESGMDPLTYTGIIYRLQLAGFEPCVAPTMKFFFGYKIRKRNGCSVILNPNGFTRLHRAR
ncbi:MAG: hypothetical protein KDK33_13475 [Leptospiraceae bacterium]|nr:hypothetical protein [Leptospiraceae bacterium]